MGCALAADHAVAKASRRLEREQVVEKAVQRALQTAVAELQHVEVSLRVSPRHGDSPTRSAAGRPQVAAPLVPRSVRRSRLPQAGTRAQAKRHVSPIAMRLASWQEWPNALQSKDCGGVVLPTGVLAA